MLRRRSSILSKNRASIARTSPQKERALRHVLASSISLILIPPSVSTVVFTMLILQSEVGPSGRRGLIWLTAILCAGGLQIPMILLLRKRHRVSAYDVPDRAQRTMPYFISTAISAVGFLLLTLLHASTPVVGLMWCFMINTLLLTLINLRWKISAHMMGLFGPPMLLMGSSALYFLPLLPIGALLGWARIESGSHTIAQVVAGAAAGVILTVLQFWVYEQYILRILCTR